MKQFSYVAAVLGMVAVAQCAQAQSFDVPVVKEGDTWEYQNFDMWSGRMTSTFSKQVVGVMGEYVRMSYDTREITKNGDIAKPVQSEATVRADLNSSTMVAGQKYDRINYKWPLEIGKHWVSQYKTEVAATATAPAQVLTTTMESEVKEWETITVPAGKFKAMKIVTKGSWTVGAQTIPGGTYTAIRWYSPDAKIEVQYTYDAFGADGTPLTRTKQQLSSYNLK